MVLSIHGYKPIVAAALVACAATPATAQVPDLKPFNYALKYNVTWNNLPIGRIRIDTTENEFRYSVSIDTKTRGIVRLFDGTTSTLKTIGRFDEDEKPIASSYESISKGDDKTKTTIVRYNMDGKIIKRVRDPADDPASRKPVPIEDANRALDPLSAMYILRKKMHDNIANNIPETKLRTYDGARLADMSFTVISRASLEIMGEHADAINTVMKRTPIAGYKEKEMKKWRAGDPTIHVYWSADGRFIPLQADIDLKFGGISAKLVSFTEKK